MALARRTWLFTLCLWLSLATVLGHALSPVDAPLQPKSGSAFSAATADVSLGAVRTGVNAQLRAQASQDHEGGGPPDMPAPVLLAAASALPVPAKAPATFSPLLAVDRPTAPTGGDFHARAPPRA